MLLVMHGLLDKWTVMHACSFLHCCIGRCEAMAAFMCDLFIMEECECSYIVLLYNTGLSIAIFL